MNERTSIQGPLATPDATVSRAGRVERVAAVLLSDLFAPVAVVMPCGVYEKASREGAGALGLDALLGFALMELVFVAFALFPPLIAWRAAYVATGEGFAWRGAVGGWRFVPWTQVEGVEASAATAQRALCLRGGERLPLAPGNIWENTDALIQRVARELERSPYRSRLRATTRDERVTLSSATRAERAGAYASLALAVAVMSALPGLIAAIMHRAGERDLAVAVALCAWLPMVLLPIATFAPRPRRDAPGARPVTVSARGVEAPTASGARVVGWDEVRDFDDERLYTARGVIDLPHDVALHAARRFWDAVRAHAPAEATRAARRRVEAARALAPMAHEDGRWCFHGRSRVPAGWSLACAAYALVCAGLPLIFARIERYAARWAEWTPLDTIGLCAAVGAAIVFAMMHAWRIEVDARGCGWRGLTRRRFAWSDIVAVAPPTELRPWLTVTLRDGARLRCVPAWLLGGEDLVDALVLRAQGGGGCRP